MSNSSLVKQNPEVALELINKEVNLGRVKGPFTLPPFDAMHISPLNIREKSTPGKFCLLRNLSYPYDATSVNGSIPIECKKVKYSSVTDAIELIVSLGRGCSMAKCDIKSAFRLVPIRPADYHLLGFRMLGKYYYDTVIPMGCASSCRIFKRFSSALHWIAEVKFGCRFLQHYLDDYIFITESHKSTLNNLHKFQSVCEKLGVPLAEEKTEGPACVLTFLGVPLDTINFQASFPRD